MGNDEMMLRIHSTLHIVTNDPAASAARGHRTCIGIIQRDLLVLGLHHLGVQCVQALYLLPQRRNLLVEPRDLGLRYRFPLASPRGREAACQQTRECEQAEVQPRRNDRRTKTRCRFPTCRPSQPESAMLRVRRRRLRSHRDYTATRPVMALIGPPGMSAILSL